MIIVDSEGKNPKKATAKKKAGLTMRQMKLASNMQKVLKGEKTYKSKKELLKDSGYSDATAVNPQKMLDAKALETIADDFRKIIGGMIPLDKMATKVQALINQTRTVTRKKIDPVTGEVIELVEETTNVPRELISLLDMYFKIMGIYAPKKVELRDPIDDIDPEEIRKELAKIDKLKKRYGQSDKARVGKEGTGATGEADKV